MLKNLFTTLSIAALITGCTADGQFKKSDFGTLLGATSGAVLGSNIGKGHGKFAAIAVGTLAGAAIGGSVGKSLDAADRSYMQQTTQRTLEYAPVGQSSTWRNPDNGHYGEIIPIKTYKTENRYCREFTQKVTVGGKTEEAYGKACRMPDGTWQIINQNN